MKKTIVAGLIALAVLVTPMLAQAPATSTAQQQLERQVRHELVTLPFYGVFDNFQYRVDGDRVVLLGEVRLPALKRSAERVVSRIPGVREVDNQIKVLPTSRFDDGIRVALYRTLYRNAVLSQYSLRAVPTIHFIVENGNVTLEGAVNREADKNIAFILANQVHGVFHVTNNLIVDRVS